MTFLQFTPSRVEYVFQRVELIGTCNSASNSNGTSAGTPTDTISKVGSGVAGKFEVAAVGIAIFGPLIASLLGII